MAGTVNPQDVAARDDAQKLEGLPRWPLYESLVGLLLVAGAIYYAVSIRGQAPDVEGADAVTGEAVIG